MKAEYIYLIGEDLEYLQRLCYYLQSHRTMRCLYRVWAYEDVRADELEDTAICLILEGARAEELLIAFSGKLPVICLADLTGDEGNLSSYIEKYQSARVIGEVVTRKYYEFHQMGKEEIPLFGFFSLGESFSLESLCKVLCQRGKKALLVNLVGFSLFPDQRNLKYMSISDFIFSQKEEIFCEEFTPYEISEGIEGLLPPESPEDYAELIRMHNLDFILEHAAKKEAEQVIFYFGTELTTWFSWAFSCNKLFGVSARRDKLLFEWFQGFWGQKGKEVPVWIGTEADLLTDHWEG